MIGRCGGSAEALDDSRRLGQPIVAGSYQRGEVGVGLILAAPGFEEDFAGFVLAIYDSRALLGPILAPREARGVLVEVIDVRQRLFEGTIEPIREQPWQWSWEQVMELSGGSWRIRTQPSSDLLESELGSAPTLVLLLGLAASGLAVLVLWRELPRVRWTWRRGPSGERVGFPTPTWGEQSVRSARRPRGVFDWRAYDRETLRVACERGLPPRLSASTSGARKPLR